MVRAGLTNSIRGDPRWCLQGLCSCQMKIQYCSSRGGTRGWNRMGLRSVPNQSIPWFCDKQMQDWWACTGRNPHPGCLQSHQLGTASLATSAGQTSPALPTSACPGLPSSTHSSGTAPFSQETLWVPPGWRLDGIEGPFRHKLFHDSITNAWKWLRRRWNSTEMQEPWPCEGKVLEKLQEALPGWYMR